MPVHFFSEKIPFKLKTPGFYSHWLKLIISSYDKKLLTLNYIFCSDDYLLEINKVHLTHDYYTDVITFDNSGSEHEIEGDVFISIDRVAENARLLTISFEKELSRVMAHGLLHLFGFRDKTATEQKKMREKEDTCLSLQKGKCST